MSSREGGSEVKAWSQDTGLNALVEVPQRDQLLRKEKDEASLDRVCDSGFPWMPSFSDFAGCEGFFICGTDYLPTPLWSLNQKPSAEFVQRTN